MTAEYLLKYPIKEIFNKMTEALDKEDINTAENWYGILLRLAKNNPSFFEEALEDLEISSFTLARILTEHFLRQHEEKWNVFLNWEMNTLEPYSEEEPMCEQEECMEDTEEEYTYPFSDEEVESTKDTQDVNSLVNVYVENMYLNL